jgi:hypothetical protein
MARNVISAATLCLLAGPGAPALAQQASPDEVRAIVAEMLAGAESRSSLLAAGGAGHDGKFYLANADGSFRLNVGGQLQFRYDMDFRDASNTSGAVPEDDFVSGFQTRRTKLSFDGNIINSNWTYRVMGNFSKSDGTLGLQDAYVQYNFGNGWKATWGQFKIPWLHEELVGDRYQLAAERSHINFLFSQDWSQGAQAGYEQDDWNVKFAFSDGLRSLNTDFTAPESTGFVVAGEADYAFTGRFEYKFKGDWKQFEDFTSPRGSPFAAMVGGALHLQQSPNSGLGTDVDRRTFGYTIDASVEGDGWNAFGAFIGRNEEFRSGAGSATFDDFGLVLQGGLRVLAETEVFARWEGLFPDNDYGLSEDVYSWLTFGVNQYYAGHAAKATVDMVIALTQTGDLATIGAIPETGSGILGDDSSGEVTLRVQFQLLF